MLSVTWARCTGLGVGDWARDSSGGLTRLGRRAIEEMNRLGIIVDVSHGCDRTTADVLAASTRAVIASHANARALRDQPRSFTDDVIRAIAASGGLASPVADLRKIYRDNFLHVMPAVVDEGAAHRARS